jgi:hypothetical protein
MRQQLVQVLNACETMVVSPTPRRRILVLREIDGEYTEAGTWWDTHGKSGTLDGSVGIEFDGNQLSFRYGDGEVQTTESLAWAGDCSAIRGQKSTGTVFIGENCLILEYTAEVDGVEERNTDTWMF